MKLSNIKFSLKSFFNWIKNLNKKQTIILVGGVVFLLLVFVGVGYYFKNSQIAPAKGGIYSEGILGTPRHINPIYSLKSETDRDLTEITFAGLMKYNEHNELVPNLAKSVDSKDGKIYEVTLRDARWSDGEKITSEDVIFTVNAIQNRNVQSPLRVSWEGVRVEKISESKIRFLLETPSPLFKEKLTLKPIPRHVWKNIDFSNFEFSKLNLNPVVSGPYKIKGEVEENPQKIKLISNERFFGKVPYIEGINLHFYQSGEELLNNNGSLDGFALPSIDTDINNSFKKYSFQLPRYFALFFNLDKFNKNERRSLSLAINKEEALSELEEINKVNSPILPTFYDFNQPNLDHNYNKEKAIDLLQKENYMRNEGGYFIKKEGDKYNFTDRLSEGDQGEEVRNLQRCLMKLSNNEPIFLGEITGYLGEETKEGINNFQEKYSEDILDPHGFTEPTGIVATSTRKKLNEICNKTEEEKPFSVTITTIEHPIISTVTKKITSQWKNLGIDVKQEVISLQQVEQKIIENKDFEAFVFGVSLQAIPDHYRWWHSSQLEKPGLNFTNYQNTEADELLNKSITSINKEERNHSLENFQNILLEDKPAIFLYSPNYIYMVSNKIKGLQNGKIINSSQRFKNINNWYINTKRKWKRN